MSPQEFVNTLTSQSLQFVFVVAIGLLTLALLKEISR